MKRKNLKMKIDLAITTLVLLGGGLGHGNLVLLLVEKKVTEREQLFVLGKL